MYGLFLDAVGSHGHISLVHDGEVISKESFSLQGNESSKLGHMVFQYLEKYAVSPSELHTIYVVSGPGSFTGIRSICLFCNTLAYVFPNLFLQPLSFFDLYRDYPIVKQSSRRDVFVKMQKNATIEIVPMTELPMRLQEYTEVYGSFDISSLERDDIILREDYDIGEVIALIDTQALKFIDPLYIKNPNIS